MIKQLFYSTILLSLFFSCTHEPTKVVDQKKEELTLGEVNFKISGADKALPFFQQGLLLLHSFEYEDSREAFLKAQEKDSTCAMAYWGEAMTYNHSLWQRQEQEKAIAALDKLAPTKAARSLLVKTPIEKDFFGAVEILFGEGTKYERDLAYNKYLESLTVKYPENHEVAAFYAISLLGASRNGRNEELYAKSARIAQGILKENAKHPGALHYLIHSFDDPEHAAQAKNAADKYAHIAPDAAHALHMPSHIYVALGRWNDVVNSNIASWNAAVKRMKRKGLDNEALSYHALSWLQYGFLQRGEVDKAQAMLDAMVKYSEEKPTKPARSYLVAMKGAQQVETNSWNTALTNIDVDVVDLPITKKAGLAFLKGMDAVGKKDTKALKEVINTMKKKRQVAETLVGEQGFAMCSAGGYANKPPSQLDIGMAKIMELQLVAHHASLKNNPTLARATFIDAVKIDEELSYSYGPPVILKPTYEAFGEWLLENGKTAEALAIFEKSLVRHPRRLLSIKGKKIAAEQLGKSEMVKAADQELAISLEEKGRAEIL